MQKRSTTGVDARRRLVERSWRRVVVESTRRVVEWSTSRVVVASWRRPRIYTYSQLRRSWELPFFFSFSLPPSLYTRIWCFWCFWLFSARYVDAWTGLDGRLSETRPSFLLHPFH